MVAAADSVILGFPWYAVLKIASSFNDLKM
jgi:hypothetical protein